MGKTFIVAEIGVNHSGNLETAKQLIRLSKWAGADAVKFQTWHKGTFPELENLRFNLMDFEDIFDYCNRIGIKWFSTPFDIWSVKFLESEGMTIWKIPSNRAVLDNKEMLEAIAKIENKKRLIISTGAFNQEGLGFYNDIDNIFFKMGLYHMEKSKISLLYCISKYPTLPIDYNLQKIITMKNWLAFYGCNIGLSDHSATISIAVAAVALGATVIEKHITLDRNSEGPDHKSSITGKEFKQMVSCIREVEKAIN